MEGKIINVLIMLLVASFCLSDLIVPQNNTDFQLVDPSNFSCVNQLPDGNYTRADDCTNGRSIIGCCVDRAHCDYNTSNIDLTMYGPRGYKSSCRNTYVCCPLSYVIPIIEVNSTLEDNDLDQDDKSDDFDF